MTGHYLYTKYSDYINLSDQFDLWQHVVENMTTSSSMLL